MGLHILKYRRNNEVLLQQLQQDEAFVKNPKSY